MTLRRSLCSGAVSILLAAGLAATLILCAVLPVPLGETATLQPSQAAAGPEPPLLGPAGCPWPAASGRRLLNRQLGSVSFSHAAVVEVATALAYQNGVPLSFIQAEPEAKVTFDLSRCTVRQLLDQVVASAPGYRYGFVGAHLVLYPSDPIWQTRIEDLRLGPDARLNVSLSLVMRLRTRFPALARLGIPGLSGDPRSFIYDDDVAVAGPASIVALFTQLLGSRASLVFFASSTRASVPARLEFGLAKLVQSLEVTAPSTILRQRGETVQLQVTAILRDGTRQDLTAAGCGTRYLSAHDKVLAVSTQGQVTALANGKARIVVVQDNLAQTIAFDVTLPGAPGHAPAP
jgi:hypothetical protein